MSTPAGFPRRVVRPPMSNAETHETIDALTFERALESTQASRSRSAADTRSAASTTTNTMISSIDTSWY
jgi:hypothetical protein